MSDRPNPSRRRQLIAGAGTVGALAAGAALLPTAQQPGAQTAQANKQTPADGQSGYQVTQHVLRYYQTARI